MRYYGKPLPSKRAVQAQLKFLAGIAGENKMSKAQKKVLRDAIEWVNNDMRYKAPEQLTTNLYIGYIDHLMREIERAIKTL